MRLIDADELKEEFSKHEDRKGYLIGDWEDIIDNAPTVCAENVDKVMIEHETIALSKGIQIGYEQAQKDFARPQGEWIFHTTHWTCSICNKTAKTIGYCGTKDFMYENFRFCPNCGAEMKKRTKTE